MSQTFPLALSTGFNSLCQSLVDSNIERGSKLAEQEDEQKPAKTIGFPQPGSEGVEHTEHRLYIFKSIVKNACLNINLQQPCTGLKMCHGTVTECDEAKLAGSHAWIVALGSEVL